MAQAQSHPRMIDGMSTLSFAEVLCLCRKELLLLQLFESVYTGTIFGLFVQAIPFQCCFCDKCLVTFGSLCVWHHEVIVKSGRVV